jgi:hypothetical protein
MRFHLAPLGLLAVGLIGCRTDRITTQDLQVTHVSDVWSGGTLVLYSPSFTGADSVPTVTVGADTLSVRSLGPDSVAVQLPDTDGSLLLSVRTTSRGTAREQVQVHGLAAVRDGPVLDEFGLAYPWPDNGNPTALAVQFGRLVQLDLRTFTISGPLAPDTGLGCPNLNVGYAPVPSATAPGLVVVIGDCRFDGWLAVAVAPGVAPDTGPDGAGEVAVHLSRGKWLIATSPAGFRVYTRTDSGTFTQGPFDQWEADGAVVSPRGDRVAPTWAHTGLPPGPPVYDPRTAEVAFSVAAFPHWGGPAAFTPEGDTLFMAGLDSANQAEVVALDATSGTVLARAPLVLTDFYQRLGGLAVDQLRPFVYALGWSDAPYLDVLDRTTLLRVATLRTPPRIAGTLDGRVGDGWVWTIVISSLDRRLYAIAQTTSFRASPLVFEYELMP